MQLPKSLKEQHPPHLFNGLEESSVQNLVASGMIQTFKSGTLLVQQGDMPEYVYLIIEGALKTFRMNDEGGEATIRMLRPGDVCMEAVLFMGGTSPINVQTLGRTKLLLLPYKSVVAQVFENAQFAINLLQIVTKHYKNAMHQIDALNIKSPLQRVGYYLLLKHIEAGHDSTEFTLPFQKQVIANYLGMTPETFSRTLKQIKELGINIEEGKVKLKDPSVLCQFCDTDTASLCPKRPTHLCRLEKQTTH